MNHSTGKPTKYEQERIDAMLTLGCVCCAQLGFWNVSVDIDHLLDGNTRMGHWYTLPVCPGHHRGAWSEDQLEIIPPDLRIAASDGSKSFAKAYGNKRDLWIKVQTRLKLSTAWPPTKILPRREYVANNKNLVVVPTTQGPEVEILPGGVGNADTDRGEAL